MFKIEVTNRWHQTFAGGHVGVLLMENIDNSKRPTPLDEHKRQIEKRLREQFVGFSRTDLLKIEILKAYRHYYKKFNKTYHVQLQLESVVQKGKSLPNVSPLVDASFAAELKTMVLTASHDANLLQLPLTIDATQGDETFTQMNGKTKQIKANDMMMCDQKGVICTIIYGQDKRTPVSPQTRRVLYVAYAPSGVHHKQVQTQLESIRDNVHLFAPAAHIALLNIYSADNQA